eukprot:Gb_23134 [translate_table: standard]
MKPKQLNLHAYTRIRKLVKSSLQQLQLYTHINLFTVSNLAYDLRLSSTVSEKEPEIKLNGKLEYDKIPRGESWDVISCNSTITKYVKCGRLQNARRLFDKMPQRDVVSWTAMVAGYAQNGRLQEARQIFNNMPERNAVSWNAMITGYVQNGKLEEALLLLKQMPEPNAVSWTVMIVGYAQNGKIVDARILFDQMPERDLVSWNAMIVGYIENGMIDDARQVFDKMPERDVISCSAMITGYSQNGRIDDARHVFDKMAQRNVVSWTAMIAGYAQNDRCAEALKLFFQMQQTNVKPNQSTYTTVLNACANLAALTLGKQVHARIIAMGYQSDIILENALITLYAKCWSIENALKVFKHMTVIDIVSWNAMIAGYAQNGYYEEALKLFARIQQRGTIPILSTFTSAMSASASLAILEVGQQVHAQIVKTEFGSDVFVENSLIAMYAKCGSIEDAHRQFNTMPKQDVVSWNSMIVGFAHHGHGKVALHFFEQMQRMGINPNHITFLGLLSACSHAGLVGEGWNFFHSMSRDYCTTPRLDHYACVVDLLGRAGRLEEAEDFIKKMPFEPHAALWGALLGACKLHGNIDLGRRAAEHLFELEPQNATAYVVLSNIYAVAGRWIDEANVRLLKKDKKVKKNPGWSWIIVKDRVHAFCAGDRLHPKTEKRHAMLDSVSEIIEEAGNVPDPSFVLHDVEK